MAKLEATLPARVRINERNAAIHDQSPPEPEGGYTVLVPALPEVVTYGETERRRCEWRAKRSSSRLEVRRDDGDEIPDGRRALVCTVTVREPPDVASALAGLQRTTVIKALQHDRFRYWSASSGSHHMLRKPGRPTRKRQRAGCMAQDLPRGTLGSIIKQAGLTVEEFIALL